MGSWGHNKAVADVKIRKLPDWVVASFKSRAANAGRSLEEELRVSLTAEASRQKSERFRELAEFRQKIRAKHGVLSDSTPGIRADRRARG